MLGGRWPSVTPLIDHNLTGAADKSASLEARALPRAGSFTGASCPFRSRDINAHFPPISANSGSQLIEFAPRAPAWDMAAAGATDASRYPRVHQQAGAWGGLWGPANLLDFRAPSLPP